MNEAAKGVMAVLPDILVAYGVSDEYRSDEFPRFPDCPREVLMSVAASSFTDRAVFSRGGRGMILLLFFTNASVSSRRNPTSVPEERR